jgi:lysozyme
MIIEQLKKDEGFSPVSFWDVKQWTWGYGSKAPGPDARITKEEAEVELNKHLDVAIEGYWGLFGECTQEINDVRQAALVNMVYNLGARGLSSFKNMLRCIRFGDWVGAAREAKHSLWYKQVGKRARRIVHELETGRRLDVV